MELSFLPLALYNTSSQSMFLFRGVKTTQEHR